MKNNRWVLGLLVVIVVIIGLSFWGLKKTETKNENTDNQTQVSGQSQDQESYFAEDAQVMYFYQDTCSWCLKEKEVLAKLGSEGYKVKSMNVGKNVSWWTDYKISGTPTFIAKNGDRLEGYHDYDSLKPWLDSHK